MATVVAVPIVMGAIYAFNFIGGPIIHYLSHNKSEPQDIFVQTSDTLDVEDGYLRIICVVQKKSYERAVRFSYPGYTEGGQYHSSVIIKEAKAGDISGSESFIPNIKYSCIKVKLEPGKGYEISYGKAGFLGLWTFPKASLKIYAKDHSQLNRRTHYVYFDEDNYFGSDPNHFYKANQLFK